VCSVDDIEIAAILNDMINIQNRGKEGKTNFIYSAAHCASLLKLGSILSMFMK